MPELTARTTYDCARWARDVHSPLSAIPPGISQTFPKTLDKNHQLLGLIQVKPGDSWVFSEGYSELAAGVGSITSRTQSFRGRGLYSVVGALCARSAELSNAVLVAS